MSESKAGSGEFTVTLVWGDGQECELSASTDESIVEAAEAMEVPLPFGCLTGACATCTAKVLVGEVAHRRPPRALKPRHLDEGYVLACIAAPRSDCRLRVGSDVATELVSNPWR